MHILEIIFDETFLFIACVESLRSLPALAVLEDWYKRVVQSASLNVVFEIEM